MSGETYNTTHKKIYTNVKMGLGKNNTCTIERQQAKEGGGKLKGEKKGNKGEQTKYVRKEEMVEIR